jgi:hypothetical protein
MYCVLGYRCIRGKCIDCWCSEIASGLKGVDDEDEHAGGHEVYF